MKNIPDSEMMNSKSSFSEMEGFEKLCSIDSIKDRQGKRFIVNDVEVAVFKVEGEIYALSNVCPHQHTTVIYDGYIEDGCVVCPVHGWMFNLKTGKMPSCNAGLDSFPVKIIDNQIHVKVFKKELKW